MAQITAKTAGYANERRREGQDKRRRATRTPPRHGTAATCALASFLVVVQRGGRRFESCSYRQGGQCLVGRSPSPDTLLFAPLPPCAYRLAFRQPVRAISAPRVVVGWCCAPRPAPRAIRQRACSCQITGKRTAPLWRCSRRWHCPRLRASVTTMSGQRDAPVWRTAVTCNDAIRVTIYNCRNRRGGRAERFCMAARSVLDHDVTAQICRFCVSGLVASPVPSALSKWWFSVAAMVTQGLAAAARLWVIPGRRLPLAGFGTGRRSCGGGFRCVSPRCGGTDAAGRRSLCWRCPRPRAGVRRPAGR